MCVLCATCLITSYTIRMISSVNNSSRCIGRRAAKKGPRYAVQNQAAGNAKSTTGYSIMTRRQKKILEEQKEKRRKEEFSKNRKLLKCKKLLKIATFNVRTLNVENSELEELGQNFKIGELAAEAELSGIDILCIQEHRILHKDVNFKYHTAGKGWVFITSSGWKNSANAANGGVGILLSPRANASLKNIEKVNSRIVVATFTGNPALSVICCYSPTNCCEDKVAEQFYEKLADVQKALPKHNVVATCGDFNAKVKEQDIIRRSFHDKTSRNGDLLLDLISENEQVSLNSHFLKKNSKLWTFTYPDKTKAHIDYILINRKWVKSAIDCQAYNSFMQIGSDHRVVVAHLRLSLRAPKRSRIKQKRYNWGTIVNDHDINAQFSVEVRNRFSALQDVSEDDIDSRFNNIVKACDEAANLIVPEKPRQKKRVPWDTPEMKEQRKRCKEAQKVQKEKPSTANRKKYIEEKKILQKTQEDEMQAFFQRHIDEINNAPDSCRQGKAWAALNQITNRKKSSTCRLKGSSSQERKKMFYSHFKELLGETPQNDGLQSIQKIVQDTLPISTEDFSMEELDAAVKSLSSGKSYLYLPVEVWKNGALNNELLSICNELLKEGTAPEKWKKSCICPIPKKGDLGLPSNYRGISLMSTAAKIYNKMLLLRIRPELEKILRKNQNGFRPGRSTIPQVLTLRRLIEGITEKQLTATLLFVDFSKAFDSIHRGTMLNILRAYGIPEKIVRGIGALYQNTTAQVRTPDGDTDFFKVLAGVLQGDTLAPYLFIIVLDYVLRTSLDKNTGLGFTLHPRRSRRCPAVTITDADFADDLALFADNNKDAEALLLVLEVAAEAVGLRINRDKTEYMSFRTTGTIKCKSGERLDEVTNFKYLGSWLASSTADMKTRIAQSWKAHNKLDKIWKSSLSREMKISLFRSLVLSILLYGAEAWTLTVASQKKLDGVFTRMLRKALGLTWRDKVTNIELYRNVPTLSSELRHRRLRFAGHCWRRQEELCSQLLMWNPTQGKRRRGAPAKKYTDVLREDTGMLLEDIQTLMADRKTWRTIAEDVRGGNPRRK